MTTFRTVVPSEKRARSLLQRHLSPAQRVELQQRGAFTVTAQSGRRYMIESRFPFNVRDANGRRYCLHTTSFLPTSDLMLTQKLLLETDERRFLKRANAYPQRLRHRALLFAFLIVFDMILLAIAVQQHIG